MKASFIINLHSENFFKVTIWMFDKLKVMKVNRKQCFLKVLISFAWVSYTGILED